MGLILRHLSYRMTTNIFLKFKTHQKPNLIYPVMFQL
ncbi:hypothetical protein PHET_06285 [Paragonimus heterotremus]|uniref:Uncharacterized protein n=1 Tax=Paragonimus heterotremus TaxID=100268 RepID=A0A8J4WY36_9TREM|nr:hypothetical protein PHET_06285 [Paragonimus heterotremus]